MSTPLSGSQIDKLSVRLRGSDRASDDDLEMLQALLLTHDDALSYVGEASQGIGLAPTTRLKTFGTIIDKLRRESPITLRSIRDLAGARIVQSMNLDDQNREKDRILALWPDAKVIDRRETPSHGYRAVHIIPKVRGCSVEIQLRTLYQDSWAQWMETMADMWGRDIRYGGLPADPEQLIADGPTTRREIVEAWINASAHVAELEIQEAARERLAGSFSEEEAAALDAEIDAQFGALRELLRHVRELLNLS